MDSDALRDLLSSKRVILCVGPGGVGKTSVSAALSLWLANSGKRVCVVTIDPAKRLASALGISTLGNKPTEIPLENGEGRLWATMLDAEKTFDDMVRSNSKDEAQAEAILTNRVYKNLVSNLSGTQEYMAMERLYELTLDERFDVVIVDTPPSGGALDFLEAPKRLIGFLDNKIFKLLIKPPPLYLRPLSIASRALLKTISKVVGADVVVDAMGFFQVFSGLEDGFKARAATVQTLLGEPTTAFVLVSSPRSDTLDEAVSLSKALEKSSHSVGVLVINRVVPDFFDKTTYADSDDELADLTNRARTSLRENAETWHHVRQTELKYIWSSFQENRQSLMVIASNLEVDIATLESLEILADEIMGSETDLDTLASQLGYQVPEG